MSEFQPLSRRGLLQAAGAVAIVAASSDAFRPAAARAVLAPARPDAGVAAAPFDLGQVRLLPGRWMDNQNRTLAYLRWVDVDRLLYNFRSNHRLSTAGAAALGGWEAPTFPFRSHSQGHFLTAFAQAWAVTGEATFRDRAQYMVAELAKCQANNGAAGFAAGYLGGIPESDFTPLESGRPSPATVPWYVLHKTFAGLLDVWRILGNTQAGDVLLKLAAWVDQRTSRLSYAQMQTVLGTEFGGMNAALADLYQATGDSRWLTAAQRFDHAAVFDPLAANQDRLNGLHANTQVPKWIGAAREYKATGNTRYRDIARNAWALTVGGHTYAIGGNSQAEHFHGPGAIAAYLTNDTCELCNSYNMLKLTRELWTLNPTQASYFDFYERTLFNHLLGGQNSLDPHGHITYFTPLRPGGRRGVGPAWGGGTWSTDYSSFWCCQGTGLETNTKLPDSIYFSSGTTLIVNLFAPSVLTWAQRGITVTQTTTYPVSDTTTLTLTGTMSGSWAIRVRIPAWCTGATISVNGVRQDVATTPGTYAEVTRAWASGDTVTVRLPLQVRVEATPGRRSVRALLFGPVVLSGNYGDRSLTALPSLSLATLKRTSTSALAFSATADGSPVTIGPFHDAHGHTYTVYWRTTGDLPAPAVPASYRLVNAASGLALGIEGGIVDDGGRALLAKDDGARDHEWELVPDGTELKLRNVASGKVLGVTDMSTAKNAQVVQWADNGTADHRWAVTDLGDGTHRIVNANSSKQLGVLKNAKTEGARVVQVKGKVTPTSRWRLMPSGTRMIRNVGTGLVLGVDSMSLADEARVIQWSDNGTKDHLWDAVVDASGAVRLRNANSGKLLTASATAAGSLVVQRADGGTAAQLWRLLHGGAGTFRLQCAGGGGVLGISGGSTTQGAQAAIAAETGGDDQRWTFA
ncbi:MAG: glycoside hydrolase family 127 protein [Kineosporiaceae bacterium]